METASALERRPSLGEPGLLRLCAIAMLFAAAGCTSHVGSDPEQDYRKGLAGLERDRTSSDAHAAASLQRAAEQGHADAQFRLATLYFEGRGVESNDAEGRAWLRRATASNRIRPHINRMNMLLTARASG